VYHVRAGRDLFPFRGKALGAVPTHPVGIDMTQTVVDQRGRILIPEDMREGAGLDEGTIVSVERQDQGIVIQPIGRGKRTWKQLCGITPKRTGKPEWPAAKEIKNIWR
jgi:AbrB family looped-hinge helix DNA binding protein